MAYMAQQAVTTAIRDAFRDRPDALEQAEEAARCRAWVESLPLPRALVAPIVEPIMALEDGLREADRMRGRKRSPMTPGASPGDGRTPDPRHAWRRPAILLAIALDAAVVIVTAWALVSGVQPIVVAFAAILAIAPWAAIIDEWERPRRPH